MFPDKRSRQQQTGQLKTIMFFYLNDTLIEGSGMPVKMVRIAFIMTMKYVATSVIRTICIFNMPVMSGVFTSKSYTKSGDIDDVKILRVDCKFIFGKHK